MTDPAIEIVRRMTGQQHVCSFCLKTQREVAKLITARDVCICNECIGLCVDLMGWTVTKPEPTP